MADAKKFIAILKRALKSKYSKFLLSNRLLMQAYSVDVDSDNGFHYTLFIPDDYDGELYDTTALLIPANIIPVYTVGHNDIATYKKLNGIKPRDIKETVELIGDELVFNFIANDTVIYTHSCSIDCDIDPTDENVMHVLEAHQSVLKRVNVRGYCITVDAIETGVLEATKESQSMYQYIVDVNGKSVRLPVMKSFLFGFSSMDNFHLVVEETTLNDVYLYTLMRDRNSIVDVSYGYVLSY